MPTENPSCGGVKPPPYPLLKPPLMTYMTPKIDERQLSDMVYVDRAIAHNNFRNTSKVLQLQEAL